VPIRPEGENLRAQWMAPVIISPHDPTRSTRASSTSSVRRTAATPGTHQPDLTQNDPAQMLPRSSNEIPYQTITALAESPETPGPALRRHGRRAAARDDGWRAGMDGVTGNVPSAGKWYSRVVPSEHEDSTVYITQRGREDDDFAAYVYKSTDFGKTFTSIVGNVPAGPVNVIREDPGHPNVLYLGTDFGAFISTNGGQRWEVLGNLPSTQVSDLVYHPRDQMIVISTYGRGMYVMDAQRVRAAR
jgi:hypothetical protein